MKKKSKLQTLLNSALVLSLISFAIFSSTPTFAYWLSILSDQSDKDYNIPIGEWDPDFQISVKSNGSSDFPDFSFKVPPNAALGTITFNAKMPFEPAPKTHSGVDQSGYTFDGWYIADIGTAFTAATIVTGDIVIYPSWNSTLFTYTTSGSLYNVAKNSSAPAYTDPTKDLYVPGWRYKGRRINTFYRNSMNDSVVNDLYIGDGFTSLDTNGFLRITGNSLYIGEGITTIASNIFTGSKFSGNLKLPSTVVSIASNTFNGFGFAGTLDLSDTHSLETIGSSSFRNNFFIGGLDFQESIKTIDQYAFNNCRFDGTLDLSKTHALKTIGTSAFATNNFIGGLDFQESITTIGQGAFSVGGFTGPLDLSKAVNMVSTGTRPFYNTGLTGTVKIGPNWISIANDTFQNSNVTGLDLSDADSLISIGNNSFKDTSISFIIFPTNGMLKTIGTAAFSGTDIKHDLVFPSTLEKIEAQAFMNNFNLENVYIPLSVTEILSSDFYGATQSVFYYEGDPDSLPATWHSNWKISSRPVYHWIV